MKHNDLKKQMGEAGWTTHAIVGWHPQRNLKSALLETRTYNDFSEDIPAPPFDKSGSYPAHLRYIDFKGKSINDSIFINPQQNLVLHINSETRRETVAYYEDYEPSTIVTTNPVVIPPQGVVDDHPEEIGLTKKVFEGAVKQIVVNVYERSSAARDACIAHYGTNCSVCGFNFGEVYGEMGTGFIHVHHLRPLASIGVEYVIDPIQDLRPVCANCHCMLHKRSDRPYTIPELQHLLIRR